MTILDTVSVMLTLTDDAMDRAEAVAHEARETGLANATYDALAGVLFGEIEAETMGKLRTVQGVKAVREEGGAFVPENDDLPFIVG